MAFSTGKSYLVLNFGTFLLNPNPAIRLAKRYLDDSSFYGSPLHVSYAPELETTADCRLKLFHFRKYSTNKYRRHVNETSSRLAQDQNAGRSDPSEAETTENKEALLVETTPSAITLPDLRFPPPGFSCPSEVIASAPPSSSASRPSDLSSVLAQAVPLLEAEDRRAFSARVPVFGVSGSVSSSTEPPRFVPRQLGSRIPAKKRSRPAEGPELRANALQLGPELGAQIPAAKLAELRERTSVTGDPLLERTRTEVRRKMRAVMRVEEDGSDRS